MLVGGVVERYGDKMGYRFHPDTIIVAQFPIEGAQATIRFIGQDIDYWIAFGVAYVGATVVEIPPAAVTAPFREGRWSLRHLYIPSRAPCTRCGGVSTRLLIGPALRSDMEAILELQRLAFRREAERYSTPDLPPLTETLPELYDAWARTLVLKATDDGRLVGSVRGYTEAGTCHIGRLAVHPAFQDCGIGTRLMRAIEARFSTVRRFEVFTGHRSAKSLHLYRKLGYTPFKTVRATDRLTLVYLAKRAA